MTIRRLISMMCVLACLVAAGCSSGNDPVNEGKDKPVHPKNVKDKEK